MIDWNGDGIVDPTEVVFSAMIMSGELDSEEDPDFDSDDEDLDVWSQDE